MKRQLGALFLVSVIDILGFGIVIPLVPYMGTAYGAAPWVITSILGSYSLCQLLAAPFWGSLSDRFGRRAILMTSLTGACVSYAILGLATNLWWLLLSRVLAGFMAGNISAAFAYATDISTPEKRAGALGAVGAAIGIGFTVGTPIGGILAGDNPQRANFVLPALVSMALSLLAIALVYFVLPDSRSRARGHSARRRQGVWRLLAARPTLRLLAGSSLLVTYAQSTLESIVALWALHRFGFGPRTGSMLLFGVALPALVMQGGVVRRLVPRFGEARLAIAGVAALVLGLLLMAGAGTLAVTILALILCGVGLGAFSPSASAMASGQAQEHERGAVLGTYQSSGSLARVLGPFTAGALFMWPGPWAPYLVGALVCMPAAWLIWQVKQRAAAAGASPPAGVTG